MNHVHRLPDGDSIILPFRANGRRAKRVSRRIPVLSNFQDRASSWPTPAPRGWEYAVKAADLDILGNDVYGDCAEAGIMHFIQVETANAARPLHGTRAQTLALYSAVTGFDQSQDVVNSDGSITNPTDNGTVLVDLLNYVLKNGVEVTDVYGNVVKWTMEAFASLDCSSFAQRRWVNDVFGGTYDGINCPQSAVEDTSNWLWNPGSPIVGGHCVNGAGQGADGGHEQSWGMNIPYSAEFILNVLDESYMILSTFWLDQQQKSPSGFDLDGLLAAAKQI